MIKKGFKHSEETKRKISNSLKGKVLPEGHRKNISEANKGKHFSTKTEFKAGDLNLAKRTEVRKKISEANKGKHFSTKTEFKKGHKPSKFSEEKRIKTRRNKGWWNDSVKSKKRFSERSKGEKNPSWRGGISFEPYGTDFNKELKDQIIKRDNYRCQECFKHQEELFRKVKGGKIKKYKLSIHHIDYNKKNNNPNNLISLCLNCHVKTNFKRDDWTKHFKEKIEIFK